MGQQQHAGVQWKLARREAHAEACGVAHLLLGSPLSLCPADRKYIPCLYVLNKCDTITVEELELLSQVPNYVPVCAGKECT